MPAITRRFSCSPRNTAPSSTDTTGSRYPTTDAATAPSLASSW